MMFANSVRSNSFSNLTGNENVFKKVNGFVDHEKKPESENLIEQFNAGCEAIQTLPKNGKLKSIFQKNSNNFFVKLDETSHLKSFISQV